MKPNLIGVTWGSWDSGERKLWHHVIGTHFVTRHYLSHIVRVHVYKVDVVGRTPKWLLPCLCHRGLQPCEDYLLPPSTVGKKGRDVYAYCRLATDFWKTLQLDTAQLTLNTILRGNNIYRVSLFITSQFNPICLLRLPALQRELTHLSLFTKYTRPGSHSIFHHKRQSILVSLL